MAPHLSPSLRLGLPAPQSSTRHHAQSLLGSSFHDPRNIHRLLLQFVSRFEITVFSKILLRDTIFFKIIIVCHQFSQIFTDYFCNLLVDSQSLFLSKLLLCVTVFFEITIVCHYFPQSYYCVLVLIESSATNCACSQCVKRTISAERVK